MKNIRILLISIPVIIIISAIIGCALTFSSAPHAALARIFIDIGALIALVSIAYTLPKPEPIHIDDIVDGLRDLAKNRFDRRLSIKQDELFQIRQAFNELAGTLSDSRDPSLTHIRYNPMNRIELKVTPLPPSINHSHHPELGQVKSAPELTIAAIQEVVTPVSEVPAIVEEHKDELEFAAEPVQEPVLSPEPSMNEVSPIQYDNQEQELQEEAQSSLQTAPELKPESIPEIAPRRPESYASDIGAADLFFLFERFKAAHDRPDENTVDFDTFMSTVHTAREDLIRTHHCRDVKFEVVNEAGAVALRPRLIR